MTITCRSFVEGDADAVIALWERAGLTRPWNDPRADIRRKQTQQPELFFVAVEQVDEREQADGPFTGSVVGSVVGAVMAGYDGHRGWIHYLAVAPGRQGTGIGRALIEQAESALAAIGCPKVQLQVRPDNADVVAVYEHLGYTAYPAISMGKRLITDD